MLKKIQKKLLNFVQYWDNFLEARLHQFFPRSLTTRYILGLGSLAILAVLVQAFEQTSLQTQHFGFRQIRFIDSQINHSMRIANSLNLIKDDLREQNIKAHFSRVNTILKNTQIVASEIEDNHFFFHLVLGEKKYFKEIFLFTQQSLKKLESNIADLETEILNRKNYKNKVFVAPEKIRNLTAAAFSSETSFRNSLSMLGIFYETRINKLLDNAKNAGILFLIATLTMLLFEALYVFRPGVKQLYDALNARTKFMNKMGHEIRNPMNSILGMTRLLQKTNLTEQQKRYTNILANSGNSLLSLLNNLVDYSKMSSGKIIIEYQDFDLLLVIQNVVDLVTYKIDEKNLDFLLNIDLKTPIKINSDPLVIQQILFNLLSNAVKFTDRGEINLKIWQEKKQNKNFLHFGITDTGIGIEENKLQEIFEYFQQENSEILRKYGGSGLGLSIGADLLKLLGGKIDVHSEKGVGSYFHFYIPLKKFEKELFEDRFAQKQLSGKSTLIAEKHIARQKTIQTYLESYGSEVILAEPDNQNWIEYFTQHEFNVYIFNYEQFSYLLDLIFNSNLESKRNILSKIVLLVRSTIPSNKLIELNSIGIKSFIYLPVKPWELLTTVDLILLRKKINKPVSRKSHKETPLEFELSKPIRALIVDDSKDNQFLMKNYLEKHASYLAFADNGIEAVEKFQQEPFDIVFMDILMPELDGYEATQKIRSWEKLQHKNPTPIIAITAHTGDDVLKKCKEMGFTDHFPKPVDLVELQNFLKKLYGTKVHLPNAIPMFNELDVILQKKLREYLPTYYKQRQEDLENLKEAVKVNEWGKIMSIGHKIKGNAATFGFPDLGKIGEELEKDSSEKNITSIKMHIDEIEDWLEKVTMPPHNNP